MDIIQEIYAQVEQEFKGVTMYVEDVYTFISDLIKGGQAHAAQVLAENAAEIHHQNEGTLADNEGNYTVHFLDMIKQSFFPEIKRGEMSFADYQKFQKQAEMAASLLLVLSLSKRNGRT